MSVTAFELTDFTKPAYLHFNEEKFWEIKLNDITFEVVVRCGRLDKRIEDENTLQTLTKPHDNLGDAITYMEKHVNLKLSKGYRFFRKEEKIVIEQPQVSVSRETTARPSYSINVIPPESQQSNASYSFATKRRNDELPPRDDQKQMKISPVVYSGDKDLDEAIALSVLEEARKKRKSAQSSQNNNNERESLSTAFTSSNETNFSNDTPSINTNFKGEYLSLGNKYVKIQVLRKYLKIEKGFEDRGTACEKEFHVCLDLSDAIKQAHRHIGDHVSKGFKSQTHKLIYDFVESDLHAMNNYHRNLHSAPVSAGGSRSNALGGNDDDDDNNYDDDDNDNNKSGYLDTLGVGNNDGYSDASRRSSLYDDDEEFKDSRTRSRSRSRGRSASVAGDDDRNDDFDDDLDPVDLGPDPLGKPVTKNYSSVLLAHKWENQDPKGWYMSEKLDGVRCFWNGRTMWSRNGKQYFPPKFFTKHFPKSPLDGELWTGRSTFQKCVSYVRKQNPIDSEWKNVRYMVFDAPELKLPFKDRYKKMKEVFSKINCPYIQLHEHTICKGKDQLDEELAIVQNLGGEGLMIRDPNSHYECRRSRSLLKVKTFEDDEAVIIGHEPGSGKYLGQCGALRVRNGKGIEFSVGSGMNDKMRARPPKIGTKITYKHQGVSDRGVPRFPTFLRIYQGH